MRRLAFALVVGAAVLLGFAGTAAAAGTAPVSATNPVTPADNQQCLKCHSGETGAAMKIEVDGQTMSGAVDAQVYEHSLHGDLACTSCHIGFKPDVHSAAETAGWLKTAKLDACATCHADQFAMYKGSFHGNLALKDLNNKAPLCADCHEPHDTQSPTSAAFRASIPGLCARCHPYQYQTYLDSYHGKATHLGDTKTAVCTDCHGGHRILPASNPQSTINKHNLIKTCGQCHPGANKNFVGFMVHVDPSNPRSSLLLWTFNTLYLILITVVFTFGAVHTSLYIYRGIKDGLYSRSHS